GDFSANEKGLAKRFNHGAREIAGFGMQDTGDGEKAQEWRAKALKLHGAGNRSNLPFRFDDEAVTILVGFRRPPGARSPGAITMYWCASPFLPSFSSHPLSRSPSPSCATRSS